MFIIIQELTFWDKLKTSEVPDENEPYTVKMTITNEHKRDIGIVHGGATCGLIDRALKGLLVNNNHKNQEFKISDSKIAFHYPGKGDYLTAIAKIVTEGFDRKYLLCNVFDSDEKCIATGTAIASLPASNEGGKIVDTFFQFSELEQTGELPKYVMEKDSQHPFRDYLKIKRTIWSPKVCQMEVQITDEHREPDNSLPHALLTILTDMASGQATRTMMPKEADAFTLELSANAICNFDRAEKLVARARVISEGRIVTAQTMIFNEQGQGVGVGSATYYIKSNLR